MKKLQFKSINYVGIINFLIVAFLLSSYTSNAQVGINTTNPNATLDIRSTNQASPNNTDGILIPKIDNFPTINPTTNQEGMLVFVTGNGTPTRGFYYWDNSTNTWLLITGTTVIGSSNTLDQAYDQGGNGLGKNINATDGTVRINGTDGFLVTGTFGTGNTIDNEITGSGTRMFFNPNKAAFRAGYIFEYLPLFGDEWDDINIGSNSTAFGVNTKASGQTSTAFGSLTTASGGTATAFGSSTTASGSISTALGSFSIASGSASTALGVSTTASGNYTTAFGNGTTASETYATAFGLASVASGVTATAFGNQTNAIGFRSTAFGSFTNASGIVSTAFGLFSEASGQNATAFGDNTEASGDYATAFGRSTVASELTATAFGTNSTASGTVATAFGNNSEASGQNSTAFGFSTTASADNSSAFGVTTLASGYGATSLGLSTTASGYGSTSFGQQNVASEHTATAFGFQSEASGMTSTAFGRETTASGDYALAFGRYTTASSSNTTAFGYQTVASNQNSTTFGQYTSASGYASTAFGLGTNAFSSYETVIGCYNTSYFPNESDFGFNSQDRIFVVGNGVDNANRSNAFTIYKSGLVSIDDSLGIATDSPTATLSVNGTANKIGGGTWAVFSDKRLKENISNYSEGLELITKIRPVNFSYNTKMNTLLGKNQSINNRIYQGVIAQDLQKIAPDMVREVVIREVDSQQNSSFLEVDPNKFTFALINAVKEQQGMIKVLEQEIETQNVKIKGMETQLKQQQKEIEAIKALLIKSKP